MAVKEWFKCNWAKLGQWACFLVIPVVLLSINIALAKVVDGVRLTAVGMIVAVIVVAVLYFTLLGRIKKIVPDTQLKKWLKTLLMCLFIGAVCGAVFLLFHCLNNFAAEMYQWAKWCLVPWSLGLFFVDLQVHNEYRKLNPKEDDDGE